MSIKTFRSWVPCHSLLLLLTAPALVAQDHNVSGNLEVSGKADILAGPLSLGTAHFFDESNVETQAEGLTIHYSETPQTWAGSNLVQGRSSVFFRVAQELADFSWQISEPDGLGGFLSEDLMKLSSNGLTVNGQSNLLPNQTLAGGNASILTLGLADNRYLNKSGGTISGNLTITGSTLTVNGNNVLTTGGVGYIKVASSGEIISDGASATPWTSGISIGGGGVVTGLWAMAVGNLAQSRGETSIALGREANAGASHSIAIGRGPFVAGEHAIGIGTYSGAYTNGSIVIGQRLKANQIGQIVLGNFNIESAYSPNYANPTDWLFVIGNGTADEARSNALVVRRNGDMEVKGTSLTVNGQQVLTATNTADFVKLVNGSYSVNGAYANPWTSAIAIGHYARAGEYSIALGYHTGMWEPGTSGIKSVAIGYIARAPGEYSVAVGSEMWAAGNNVVAVGRMATTRSDNAVAIGHYTEANQVGQVVLGSFNERTNYSNTPYPTDTLFMLGNGTADNARSNALIIKRNGNMEVKGTSLTVNGAEVLTQAALDDAIEDVNLGTGNYISRNGTYGMTYGNSANALAHSIALGQNAVATGSQSSSAIGYHAVANRAGTHALGNHVVANRTGQIVLGNFNDYGGNLVGSDTLSSSDALFIIGNGTAENARSNALVIRQNGDTEINASVNISETITASDLSITQSAKFGTVFSGTSSSGYNSLGGFTFDVAQATETNPLEIIYSSWVDGYESYEYGTEDVWGWVTDGYWQDQWGGHEVIGQEYISPIYDENGIEIQAGYYQDIYGPVYQGQVWVSQEYWGVVGSNPVMIPVWHEGYTNTWSEWVDETSHSAPRLQFSASRSDANWVWRNPSHSNPGGYDDILVVWNGGLKIPTSDSNRSMALTAESLSQHLTTYNSVTGSSSAIFTNLGAQTLELVSTTTTSSGNLITEKVLTNPQRITVSTTTQEGGSSIHRQSSIGAASSTLEGAVQINGTLNVSGGMSFGGQPMSQIFVPIATTNLNLGLNSSSVTGGIALGENTLAKDNSINIGFGSGFDITGGILPGENSVAIGSNSISAGENAITLGKFGFSNGKDSIALGTESNALHNLGIAIGAGAESALAGQIVLGAYNSPSVPSSLVSAEDDLLVIGNGASDTERSNALVLKRNGDLHVQGSVLTVGGEPVLTVSAAHLLFASATMTEYLTSAAANDAFQAKAPTGRHFVLDNEVGSIISPSIISSETSQRQISNDLYLSVAQAQTSYLTKQEAGQTYVDTQALEDALDAYAASTEIDARYLQKDVAVGLGYGAGSIANPGSVAFGTSAVSSGGDTSLAVGVSAVANNKGTHALGTGVVANRPDQTVVGTFNEYGTQLVNDDTKAPTDAIFVVGSGTSDLPEDRKNAIEVKRNGDVDVGGVLRVKPAGNLSMGSFTAGSQP